MGRLLGTRQFPADGTGYQQLLAWLQSFGQLVQVGVEEPAPYGAALTRHSRRHEVAVVEVNRPDRQARRRRGKSDPLDADSAARRTLAGQEHSTPRDTTTVVEAIRLLHLTRSGAIKARTAAYNQIKDLIINAPDPLRAALRGMTLPRVAAEAGQLPSF